MFSKTSTKNIIRYCFEYILIKTIKLIDYLVSDNLLIHFIIIQSFSLHQSKSSLIIPCVDNEIVYIQVQPIIYNIV